MAACIEQASGVAAARRPARKSPPAGRMLAPSSTPPRATTTRVAARARVSSWMTTASAPSGTRSAGEDAHRLAGPDACPGRARRRSDSPMSFSAAGTVPTSARARHSRPWRRRRTAAASACAVTSSASTRLGRAEQGDALGAERRRAGEDARAAPRRRGAAPSSVFAPCLRGYVAGAAAGLLESARMPSMLMSRSTAFSMS